MSRPDKLKCRLCSKLHHKVYKPLREATGLKANHVCQAIRRVVGNVKAVKLARSVGLANAQSLHHFLQRTPWQVEQFQARRLELIKQLIGEQTIILCIDETGDKKAGKITDYVAKQYIGNFTNSQCPKPFDSLDCESCNL